jgi:hypothetical protein
MRDVSLVHSLCTASHCAGALEIENMIQECVKTGGGLRIIEIIMSLRKDFIESSSMNARKGGLISMAAVALGLGEVLSTISLTH